MVDMNEMKVIADSAVTWQMIALPGLTIEAQEKIVASEREEFAAAETVQDKAKEAADVIWTLGMLAELHEQAGDGLEADLCRDEALSYADFTSRKHLRACRLSNWTKLFQQMDDLEKARERVGQLNGMERFDGVELCKLERGFYCLRGTDLQNPKQPQYNKILKPHTFKDKDFFL